MFAALLGPFELRTDDDRPIEVTGSRLRALAARLALAGGRPVGVDVLVDDLWGGVPPGGAQAALQTLVSRLRRALRTGCPDGAAEPVESGAAGYRLAVAAEAVDAVRFERLAAAGAGALREGEDARAADLLRAALALWRGPALADLADAPFAASAAARLAEARLTAVEDLLDALLRLGGHAEAVAVSEPYVAGAPLRERLRAARVRALGGVGRQAEALAVYEQTRTALADELGVDPSAGLAAAHLAVLRGEIGPVTAPARAPVAALDDGGRSATANRPRQPLTSFVGRERDVARVGAMLAEGRLVTLVGPGGSGKTRLAGAVATGWTPAPGDGAYAGPADAAGGAPDIVLAELAPVGEPDEVPRAVLAALGVTEPTPGFTAPGDVLAARARRTTLDRITETIGARRVLLLLDNCEHLVVAAARLADELLRRCPALSVLATSREPLTIAGESVYPVPPLAAPESPVTAPRALEFAAVRLFADRAAAVWPDFGVVADNVEAVAAICGRLDGLPLAIELAAARVRSLSARQIAERLDDRFRLLTGGSRVGLARHRTLRAVVEWSWELLGPAESLLARRFSVFAGGATLEALEGVCADAALPAGDVLDALAGLVDKSLVEAVGSSTTRYRMLETIHEYSAERLREAGEREALADAHGRYFRDLAEDAAPRLHGPGQATALAVMDADFDNLMAAYHRALPRGDADLVLRIAAALGPVWTLRGLHAAAATWLTDALAVPGESSPDARALALCFGVVNLAASGRFNEVEPHAAELLDLVRRHRLDERHPLLALVEPAMAIKDGDDARVIALLDAVVARPEPVARACGLLLRGHVLEEAGDPEHAERDVVAAIGLLRSLGDRWLLSLALGVLAQADAERGDYEAAAVHGAEAEALVEELGAFQTSPLLAAQNALHLARAGDIEGARTRLRAFVGSGRAGQLGAIMLEGALAEIGLLAGDLEAAHGHGRRALELYETAAEALPRQIRVMVLTGFAQVEIARGELAAATTTLDEAIAGALDAEDLPVLGSVMALRARLVHAGGEPDHAAWLLGRAARIRGRLNLSDPHLWRFVEELRGELGEAAYLAAFADGRDCARETAVAQLRAETPGAAAG